ncbi:pre-mRNA 3' end processing protein WDR33-like [Aulostomus maculatus]
MRCFRRQRVFQRRHLIFHGRFVKRPVHHRNVDYTPSVVRYLENRVWQRDHRDFQAIQPDAGSYNDVVPPIGMLNKPMNAVTTKWVRTVINKVRCPVYVMRWTPEGRRLITGAASGEVTLWSGHTFNFQGIFRAHDTPVGAMTWSHNGMWMLTADHGGYVKYWQSNMSNSKMFQAHKEAVREVSFSPTDNKFVTCSEDSTICMWDLESGHEERILRGHGADVMCVDWHPIQALVVSGSKGNQHPMKFWDPRTGQNLATLYAHKKTVVEAKWNQNGNWLLTASHDKLCKLFDIRKLKEALQVFRGHKQEVTAVAWHPVHEGLFASGGSDGSLHFWQVGVEEELGGVEVAHKGVIWSLAWHPLGHILCSGSNDHTSKFWTRNPPGDKMIDRYNMNLRTRMSKDVMQYGQEVKPEEMSIPGLDWGLDEVMGEDTEHVQQMNLSYDESTPALFTQNDVPLMPPAGEVSKDQQVEQKMDIKKETMEELEQEMVAPQ